MFIYDTPARKVDPIPACVYLVEWHHRAACAPPTSTLKADDPLVVWTGVSTLRALPAEEPPLFLDA